MKSIVKKQTNKELVKEIALNISSFNDAIVNLCNNVAELLSRDRKNIELLIKEMPTISKSFWFRCEAVGSSRLTYRLLTASGYYIQRIQKLSIVEQENILDNGVQLLLPDGDSIKLNIVNATPDQLKQIFNGDKIRDLAGQRAYLESIKTQKRLEKEAAIIKDIDLYEIKRKKLIVLSPCSFSVRELKKILSEMK